MVQSAQMPPNKDQISSKDRERFANRIGELAMFVGGPKQLAERSGLSRAVIGKYLAGKSEPSRDRLIRLAQAGGISIRWLATGDGAMRATEERCVHSSPPANPPPVAGSATSTIHDGDLMLLEVTRPQFKQDGIYAIVQSGGVGMRRLARRIDGSVEIGCDNPAYGSEVARPEAIKILGRVLWFGKRL